ncbi:ATP synthase subunit I [Kingella potus]|uniref:ATP synthase subunit I n=1 Tax=Kingella potus TaxID=265175 RepID=UPI001FD15172|nr:ATP synthase subunit I [Kingella potus]UOP00641.1 ATP synthase subunit I [Kingella potus]
MQFAALVAVTLLCGAAAGSAAAWSAVAGGLSYFIPSIAAVLFLNIFRNKPQYAGYAFLIGEGLRIVLALFLMVAVFALFHRSLKFLPFLFGLLAVSQIIFFVFWKAKYYGKRK